MPFDDPLPPKPGVALPSDVLLDSRDGGKRHTVVPTLRGMIFPANVSIRAWREADFPAVQRLSAAEGWTTPSERPAEALAAWLDSWPVLVAVSSDTVVGFLRALSDGMVTTYVAEVLVAPDWRRRGVGSTLLNAAQRLCPGSRLDLLSTGGSGRFYERENFRAFAGYRRSWAERGDATER